MDPVILWRDIGMDQNEKEIASKYFRVEESRIKVGKDQLVIPRYSYLPYPRELENDILLAGSNPINTYKQHCYVADLTNWYYDLQELTPKTWFRLEDVIDRGMFILKGLTNSRKQSWKTHMFAHSKKEAIQVYSRLMKDPMISEQGICIRQFVPLKTLMIAMNGQPITEEFRFFICDGEVLSGGYYWSSHVEELKNVPDVNMVPAEFLKKVIEIVKPNIRAFVIDVGHLQNNDWTVIELNDFCMSGLSENNPDILYGNLRKHLMEA